ncbi:MAG: ABC transporter substrate-binding protein, partial [Acidimicrobiaceae bacterium]|nr:ABC transporter substrate-binding protein [Acidimicrobiaceae bacterium]
STLGTYPPGRLGPKNEGEPNSFEQGPASEADGERRPCPGYKLTDGGKKFTMTIRPGVKFTDGTPLNAASVVANIKRAILPANGCPCLINLPIASVSATGPDTVQVDLTRADGQFPYAMAQFYVYSPTALQKEGKAQFALKPVGAGPFSVVSAVPNSKLVLARNPNYWQKGLPHLDKITFVTTATDESAYEALLAGQGQAYEDITTYSLLPQARKKMQVSQVPSALGAYVVQLNTQAPPFNNIKAREAIYYATNPAPIEKGITDGAGTLTETGTEPGGLLFIPKVNGFRTYNLAKAKELVKQLGGLTVSLKGAAYTSDVQMLSVLKAQWAQAGIKTTLSDGPLTQIVNTMESHNWQAYLQSAGGFAPGLGVGLVFRFESKAPFSGVADPKLDKLITTAAAQVSKPAMEKAYSKTFSYLASQAYGPFLFTVPQYDLVAKGVSAPGLTTDQYEIFWQNATAK